MFHNHCSRLIQCESKVYCLSLPWNFSHIYKGGTSKYNLLKTNNRNTRNPTKEIFKLLHGTSRTAFMPSNLLALGSTSSSHFHNGYFNKRNYSSSPKDDPSNPDKAKPVSDDKSVNKGEFVESEENLSLVQKFKLMYRRYWYVLLPVHAVTSVVWYGAFFFAAKSGFDIVPLLEKLNIAEQYLAYLRNSNAGYYGIAYALYKIASPARYTVTLGGTTLSINYLKNRGYIKPVPTKEELKVMYEDKKEEFKDKTDEMRGKYHEKRDELFEKYQEKKEEMMDKYKEKIKDKSDKTDNTKEKER